MQNMASSSETSLENMASNSSKTTSLLEFLEELLEWRSNTDVIHNEAETPWTEWHIYAVSDHVNHQSSNCFYINVPDWICSSCDDYSYKLLATRIAAFFAHELKELFEVLPKLRNLSKNHKNNILAVFVRFLLRLLYHRTYSMRFFEDQINILERRLGFLHTVLMDTSFLGAELQQVHDLFAEFEAVANDAATLIHSFIFVPFRVFKSMRIGRSLDALLESIENLEANIIKFSNMLPFIISDDVIVTPKTVSVDSLFIVNSLLYDLDELMSRSDDLILNVKNQISVLRQQLMLSRSPIKGMKASPHNSKIVQDLKAGIRDVAYEAEYLINSYLVGDAPPWYLTIRLTDLIHRIMRIWTRLQEVTTNYDLPVLQAVEDYSSSQASLQTARVVEVDDIMVGFEDRAKDILDQLVGGRESLQTISIFGMAGIGKTTCAKKFYNHPLVTDRFDRRSWCVVSQSYERKRLLTDILIGLTSEDDKDMASNIDEETLVVRIHQCLKGRRYLIVLDDMWDPNVWDDVWRCFPDDGNGSRILFTSRNSDVALPDSLIYQLPSFSDDQCWELLEKKVFRNEACPPELLVIGKLIASECLGLPLAVVVVAGILSNIDKERNAWENVAKDIIKLSLFDGGVNSMMIEILKLSYVHLPEHLKPCFLYFGIFQEQKEFNVRNLMRLWVAEGFIAKDDRKSAESVAEEYLMGLIDKSLVIVSDRRSDGGIKACVIHDLLRELCWIISRQENFCILVDDGNTCLKSSCGRHVRSFHGRCPDKTVYVGHRKLIRVLLFELDCPYYLVGMEFLVQLRYLVITDIPEPIDSLVNLEYLLVTTSKTVTIPSVMTKMLKLRYFHVWEARYGDECDSSRTNNLQSLSKIMVRNLRDEEMLRCSPDLRKLNCSFERSYIDEEEAYPDLSFLTHLESLSLMIYFYDPCKMVEHYCFPCNIKKLTLSCAGFPWGNMSSMIGKGLPKLQVLKVGFMSFVGEIWETGGDDEFQQLTFLQLNGILLRQWDVASSRHFPKLQQLVLRDCLLLEEIPCEIGEITTLQSIELHGQFRISLIDSAKIIEQKQRDMGEGFVLNFDENPDDASPDERLIL